MEYNLTNDADYLLCVLYKNYKERRKNGENKSDAKFMGSSENIFTKMLSEWTFEDVDETCRELDMADMLQCLYADDVVVLAILEDAAIIYMENRFKNGLSDLLDNISRLKSILF